MAENDVLQHKCPPRHRQRINRDRKRINGIITREIHGILYDVMVMTTTSNVYDKEGYTLTEIISDIADALSSNKRDIDSIGRALRAILKDAPKTMNSFRKVWDYVNLDTEDPKSRLAEALDTKVDKIPGKGLSTHDLTDILYEKLVNDYTKEELDERFQIIIDKEAEDVQIIDRKIDALDERVLLLEEEPNLRLAFDTEPPSGTIVGDVYAKVIDED